MYKFPILLSDLLSDSNSSKVVISVAVWGENVYAPITKTRSTNITNSY
jgi:hypothetical protein